MHCAFVVVAYDICTPCVYSSAYTAWHWHKKNHNSNKLLEFLRIFALVLKMLVFTMNVVEYWFGSLNGWFVQRWVRCI